MMRGIAVAAIAVHAALAAAPVITELKPRGAELGRPFTLTAVGRNIGEGVRIATTLPASFTLVTPPAAPGVMQTPGRSVSFLVEPKADAAPGVYAVRIETPSGMSNILLFTLGTFPEVTEEESQPGSLPNRNDTIETAEPVRATPVVVNGTLRGPERDIYRAALQIHRQAQGDENSQEGPRSEHGPPSVGTFRRADRMRLDSASHRADAALESREAHYGCDCAGRIS